MHLLQESGEKLMKLRFLGAAKTVTGSFYVLETGQTRFAVDCGLFQGPKELQERNYQDFPVNPASIDFLIITHAHIDHTGLIPKLCKQGFKGTIYCTHATEELCAILLPDSAHIQEMEVERKNRKLARSGQPPIEPIYNVQDAMECMSQFRSLNMDEIIDLSASIKIRLRDAGHILGSAMAELWITEGEQKIKIVFTGDMGNLNQPIVKDPSIIENCDYLVMESTYGNRLHGPSLSRSDELQKVIEDTMKKGGNLIIPAFAVERTQDLLYDLVNLSRTGKLDPDIEIYIDSPLAISATEIFMKNYECFDDETRALMDGHPNFLDGLNIKYSRTKEDSIKLNNKTGNAIIISASGMCEAGRIKHHLKHNLWRPESTVLFVGYQAAGTLGRRILDGEKVVTIHGEKIAIKADIKLIDAYSAHADRNGLIKWLDHFVEPPRRVFIVHGEPEAQTSLAEYLEKDKKYSVFIPDWLEEVELTPAQEVITRVLPSSVSVNQAMEAERKYLEVSARLHDIFNQNWSQGQYERIIQDMEKIASII
ncbi:MBL fold metallo-hydrolase RNA specificity domain-containing protein [Syntrophomonas palmitatica]|uniref:MBL fold metallo-hydrolase RNA specificity domain-containing protein n=1 Tax=Syntrophomonas palmitatica TaxID=402877 RepID=UPI000A95078F|nr:MBL fold metallo-hydrolase [Syntrophomonas palmitatica]